MENTPASGRPNIFKSGWAFVAEVYTKDWFDPHSGFLRLKSFWVPFLTVIAIFVLLCRKVYIQNDLEIDLIGWNVTDMYRWFQIPLWELALLMPVIGLFNANHKSEQTKAQMELTRSQNNFANYYKHAEEFAKHCKTLEDNYKDEKLVIYARKLHSAIYPGGPQRKYKLIQRPS